MTPQQDKILAYFRDRLELTGRSPSYRQIMRDLGLSSTSTVYAAIQLFIRRGILIRLDGKGDNLRFPGHVELSAATTRALRAELERRNG